MEPKAARERSGLDRERPHAASKDISPRPRSLSARARTDATFSPMHGSSAPYFSAAALFQNERGARSHDSVTATKRP